MTRFKLIRFIIYSLLIVIIINMTRPYQSSTVDKDIKPYYNEYMIMLKNHCSENEYFNPNFKIEFSDLNSGILGMCITYPKKFIIYLDKLFWKHASDLEKFQLTAHEATHCHLLQDHVQDPNHYMAPYFADLSKEQLYKQIEELLKEKCHGKKSR